MPAISIVVPIYNVEKYLHKCIDSILSQNFTDLEIVLVNDGSTDSCGRICDEYSIKDNRVKVIHKKNGGLSDARNTGIEISTGDFIGFVDSDDWVEPNMYETLYNLCISNSADISTCSIFVWDIDNRKKTKKYSNTTRIFNSQTAIQYLYDGKLSGFPAWNKLYKRSIFENIEFPKGRIYEDAAIMYRLFSNANKIIYLDFPLYNYIHRESSITRSKFSEKRFDAALNYKEAYSYMEKNQPEICEKLDSIYFTTLRSMIVDIIHERSIFKNYKYISEISKLIRNNNKKIIKNNMVSLKHKILAQFLAWCPILGLFFYKILFLKYNFEK